MVSRTWRAWTTPDRAEGFAGHLRRTGILEAQSLAGYRGHLLARDDDGQLVRFTLVTLWSDLDAVRGFAGDEIEVARAYPGDRRWLAAADDSVEHATVVSAGIARDED